MTTPTKPTGYDGPRCLGKLHQRDGLCGQVAGWGTDHVGVGRCKLHGGSTPTHVKAAHAEQFDKDASVAVQQLRAIAGPAAPISDPLTALSLLAGEVVRFKDTLASFVSELTDIRYRGVTGEQLRAELAAYGHALDRCNTVLSTIARLNLDERMVRISEQQAALVLDALEAGFDAAGLDHTSRRLVRQTTARRLELVRSTA